MYAFVDRARHYYLRVGSFTIHRAPQIEIVLNPPRMEERYVKGTEIFEKVLSAFHNSCKEHGGDPIAINLFKEHCIMAKNPIFIVNPETGEVTGKVATSVKALELINATPGLTAIKTLEEFSSLSDGAKLAIADLDAKVATLDNASKLERAWEVLSAYEMPTTAKPARSKGVKSLIRDLFAVEGARHTVAEICALTGGTEVSVKTALSDLRSPTYCVPGEPLVLTLLPSKHYALLSTDDLNEIAINKLKAEEDAKAAKEEAKAAKAEAAAAKKAEAEAAKKATAESKVPASDPAAAPAKKAKGKKAAAEAGGEAGGAQA